MAVDIGEATLHFSADVKQLDRYLAKVQRAIQAMRDVLNEPDQEDDPVDPAGPC